MPNSPNPNNNDQRLALIQRLWRELQAAPEGSKEREALMKSIRQETDAFRQALSSDDPTKF